MPNLEKAQNASKTCSQRPQKAYKNPFFRCFPYSWSTHQRREISEASTNQRSQILYLTCRISLNESSSINFWFIPSSFIFWYNKMCSLNSRENLALKSLLRRIKSLHRKIRRLFSRINSLFRQINSSFRILSYVTKIQKQVEKVVEKKLSAKKGQDLTSSLKMPLYKGLLRC